MYVQIESFYLTEFLSIYIYLFVSNFSKNLEIS